ncbi:EF-P 5-aminopentanol modification-associated protein YfmF [Bacillus piscicola]|uniref:EF-P 5-aminopentanol modification-associated protein YfmF n=1 Tax=Bacillus piscicola TaxID=1632684 RepID=UPI001F096C7A|nr:pitrilysin family protein [Bacillus piscicola]
MIKEKVLDVNKLAIHLLPSPKYKTTTLVLQISTKLEEETVTARALLAQVLKSATRTLPSRKEIRRYLDDLYGASFMMEVQKRGEEHVITMKMETANEKFLQDNTPLFQKSTDFLKSVLEDPYLDKEGDFSEKIIREEKRILKQQIESIYDDKIRYANKRLVEEMCKGEPYAIHAYGFFDQIDNLTTKDLQEEYERMLAEDDIRLFVTGNITEEEAVNAGNVFSLSSHPELHTPAPALDHVKTKPDEVLETDDIQQGKLHIGYRVPIRFADDEFAAMQVMNGLFGGFPHSKLFMNVREKESAAYYAASRYDSQKGLLLAFAGIEASNYKKVTSIIEQQLAELKEGSFTEESISQTKKMLKNQLLETADSARGLIDLYYQGVIGGRKRDLESWLAEIDAVTKQDITDCALNVSLDTTYFLHGEEEIN